MKTKLTITIFHMDSDNLCKAAKTYDKIYNGYMCFQPKTGIIIGGRDCSIGDKCFLNTCTDIINYLCSPLHIKDVEWESFIKHITKDGWKY